MPVAPGTRIGRYEVRSLLGQGGMGEVYRAADTSLGRDVALKVLDASVAVGPERVHRFLQEARAASALNHPNIIAIHEAGESNGVRFIASELVEGRTLRDELQDGPLPLARALDIGVQIASALAAAHAAGIVHRDIKPENVMLRPDGYAKVLDFGLAKLTDTSASGAHPAPDAAATMLQTTAGVIMGTVAYMSPEQARALKVDTRTDCFSLGAVIFEMLTGRQPFTGATGTDVMVSILEREAPFELLRKEGLPFQLVWVLSKALEKNPELRHQSAVDLRVDLERVKRDVATGAVYADQQFSPDRPSVILRDVSDSDPDAVAMYGLSRSAMVWIALGIVALIALPFAYARTAGATQKAGLAEAAAEIRGRDIAAGLGRSTEGLPSSGALEESQFNLEAVRNLGPDEVTRAIREGYAAQWTFQFDGTASDQQAGDATVRLTPDGKLRAFSSVPRTKRPAVTLTREAAIEKAAAAAKQYLGADVSSHTLDHAWQVPDGTSFEIEWKNPTKVFGHDETIRANLDDTSFSALERRFAYKAPEGSPFVKRLNEVRGAFLIFIIAVVYVFGIVVLARTKRWSLVGRPVPIAMSACLALGFLSLVSDDNGNFVSVMALLAFGLLIAFGALPAFAGIYGWLKQGSAVRMHGAEQLAAGHVRSPAVGASLIAGIAAGAMIAAVSLVEWAVSMWFDGYDPSVGRELSVASPGFYTAPGAWIAAALGISLAVAVMYELPHRLFKHGKPMAAFLVALAGALTSSGQPVWISMASTVVAAAILMTVYAHRGLAAAFAAVVATPLLVHVMAGRSVGGPVAGPRATVLTVALLALIGLAVMGMRKARKSDDGRSKISSRLGI